MRIAIDMQGAQGSGRFRGIGRYTLALAEALLRNNSKHEIVLVLSGLFPESLPVIHTRFERMLPKENIRVWTAPGPVDYISGSRNTWRRQAAELVREAFISSLQPDVVLVSSMIEGIGDNSVTSVNRLPTDAKIAAIVYDLIPLINQENYLANPIYRQWYMGKLGHLKKADLFLSISESSMREAIQYAQIPEEKIFNISTAADPKFRPANLNSGIVRNFLKQIGIVKPFIFYCGGSDPRKNLPRLLSAYAALPETLREAHQLLLSGAIPNDHISDLKNHGEKIGLKPGEMEIPGYLDDESIIALYGACKCFVLPSWHEGFGLPALEAMSCGAPVIGSNTSSLPEVIGNPDALFDPFDEKSISKKIAQVLSDEKFRKRLIKHGLEQSKKFSWDLIAKRALVALESTVFEEKKTIIGTDETINGLIQAVSMLHTRPEKDDLLGLATAIDFSFPEAALS